MAIYEYKAFSSSGKVSKGFTESDSIRNARQKLKKQGLMVTEIKEKMAVQRGGKSSFSLGGGVGTAEIALMTRQLASLIKANIPLVDALDGLVEQTDHPRLKLALAQVRQDVNEGSGLAKALEAHPKIFDRIFINMVEAGESSGTLGLVLLRLADLKEGQMRLKSKIQSAMMYPMLMSFVGCVLLIGIFAFVIPELKKVFESSGKAMPATTEFLMNLSDFIVSDWPVILVSAFGVFFFFQRYIQTKSGRSKWDRIRLKAPVVGGLVQIIAVTRFANTMGTLLSSGVPILTAMNIAKNLVGNVHIANAINIARENVTEGQSIAAPLKQSGEFPPLVIHMIAIGEKTGELPDMLKNVSETYEEQVNSKIEGLVSLLEPVMLVFMGIVVGFIVMSIFMPLLDLSSIS